MPRRNRPSEQKKAHRRQEARDREMAALERRFHAEWQVRQAAVDDADEELTQPEIRTSDDNGGDEQP